MLLRSVQCRATAATLGLLTGCSWVFVQKPPQGPMQPASPLACTSNVVAPVADTVGAVLVGVSGGMVAVAGLGMTEACEPWCTGAKVVLVAGGLLELGAATVLAFSAGYGYSNTAECRALKEAQLSCTSGVEEACRTLQGRK